MTEVAEEFLQTLLTLDEDDRMELAEQLVRSVKSEPTDNEVADDATTDWETLVDERRAAVQRGEVSSESAFDLVDRMRVAIRSKGRT